MQLFHKNNGAKSLIIFFSGWALDFTPFARLFSNDLFSQNDLLFVWDYRTTDFEFDFSKYDKVAAISYSYGVFMSQFVEIPKLSQNIAICGTLCPIDVKFGINPRMFDLTLKTLNEKNLEKFYRNMFVSADDYERFIQINTTKPNIENLKKELENIKALSTTSTPFIRDFSKVIITENDRIIPTNAQLNFWENKSQIKTITGGHFPFFEQDIEDIIQ